MELELKEKILSLGNGVAEPKEVEKALNNLSEGLLIAISNLAWDNDLAFTPKQAAEVLELVAQEYRMPHSITSPIRAPKIELC